MTKTAASRGAQAKVLEAGTARRGLKLPAEPMSSVLGFSPLLLHSEGIGQQIPETWARCTGSQARPLWFLHLYFQVFAEADHLNDPNPKVGETGRGSKALRTLAWEV